MTELKTHHLLTSQRNEIFTTLQNRDLNPTDFSLEETDVDKDTMVSLVQKATNYFFRIRIRPAFGIQFIAIYSPGSEFSSVTEKCDTWPEVVMNLEFWISNILRETETPDLWDGLGGDNQLLQDATEQPVDNPPFTQAELPQVRECLKEIKAYVINTKELTETQRKIIDARFNYMEEASTRMGRKDWLSVVIGNLLGIAFSLALTGDSTRDLFGFAALIIKRILGTMLYLANPH